MRVTAQFIQRLHSDDVDATAVRTFCKYQYALNTGASTIKTSATSADATNLLWLGPLLYQPPIFRQHLLRLLTYLHKLRLQLPVLLQNYGRCYLWSYPCTRFNRLQPIATRVPDFKIKPIYFSVRAGLEVDILNMAFGNSTGTMKPDLLDYNIGARIQMDNAMFGNYEL